MTQASDTDEIAVPNRMFWEAGLLIVLLVVLRVVSMWPDLQGLAFSSGVAALFAGIAEDLALVLVAVFLCVLLFRTLPQSRTRLIGNVFSVTAGLVNLLALRMLGAPLTMDWVRYSDVGNTDVIFDSLLHLLPVGKIAGGIAVVGGLLLLARVAARRGYAAAYPKLLISLAAGAMMIGFVLMSRESTVTQGKLRNPIVAFTQSLFSDGGQSRLDQLAQSDAANFGLELPFDRVAGLELPQKPAKPLKNILFFAFESTPAKQAEGWGGTQPVTPNLRASLANAIAFCLPWS